MGSYAPDASGTLMWMIAPFRINPVGLTWLSLPSAQVPVAPTHPGLLSHALIPPVATPPAIASRFLPEPPSLPPFLPLASAAPYSVPAMPPQFGALPVQMGDWYSQGMRGPDSGASISAVPGGPEVAGWPLQRSFPSAFGDAAALSTALPLPDGQFGHVHGQPHLLTHTHQVLSDLADSAPHLPDTHSNAHPHPH